MSTCRTPRLIDFTKENPQSDLKITGSKLLVSEQECCVNSIHIREFLEYVDGAAGHARIPPGGSWTDPDWGGGASAMVRDCDSPYRAQLAWPNVRWRRPAELVPDELQLVISGVSPCEIEGGGNVAGPSTRKVSDSDN